LEARVGIEPTHKGFADFADTVAEPEPQMVEWPIVQLIRAEGIGLTSRVA
jgi:hypothetical protein